MYGMIFYALAGHSVATTIASQYVYAFEYTLLILIAVEVVNFFLVFLIPSLRRSY